MPKRNRRREAMKSGQLPSMKLATASPAAKPIPAPNSTPSSGDKASPVETTAPAPSRPHSPPPDPEKKRQAKRDQQDRHRANLKLKTPAILAELMARWPKAFPADPAKTRPWAIGLTNEIVKHGMQYRKNLIRAALK